MKTSLATTILLCAWLCLMPARWASAALDPSQIALLLTNFELRKPGAGASTNETVMLSGTVKGATNNSIGYQFTDVDEDGTLDTVVLAGFDFASQTQFGNQRFAIEITTVGAQRYLRFPLEAAEGDAPPLGLVLPFFPPFDQLFVPVSDRIEFSVEGDLASATGGLGGLLAPERLFASSFEADEAPGAGKGLVLPGLRPVAIGGQDAMLVDTNGNGIPEPGVDEHLTLRFDPVLDVLVFERAGDAYIFLLDFQPSFEVLLLTEQLVYPPVGLPELVNARISALSTIFIEGAVGTR